MSDMLAIVDGVRNEGCVTSFHFDRATNLFWFMQVTKEALDCQVIGVFQVLTDPMVLLVQLDVKVNQELTVYQASSLYVLVVCCLSI